MTPEQLTGLAVLLMEVRDWLDDQGELGLDRLVFERVIDVLGLQRQRLVLELGR